jgi:transcriptional regulator with XRE-family HTH domain
MKTLTALKAKAEEARSSQAYRAEGASVRFTEDLVALMKTSGLTRTALAEKIGSSPAYITKILRGDTNFTLDSMVKIATALGCELTIGMKPLPDTTRQQSHKVNYRDIAPRQTSMLNDHPVDSSIPMIPEWG